MSVTISVESVPTGEYAYVCYREESTSGDLVPRVYAGFHDYTSAVESMVAHRDGGECSSCAMYGCYVTPVGDVDGLPEVNLSNRNFVSVFALLGVDFDRDDLAGVVDGETLLAACLVALSPLGVPPVVHSRQPARHGNVFEFGLSEDDLVDRVRRVADVATEAVRLNRAVQWQ